MRGDEFIPTHDFESNTIGTTTGKRRKTREGNKSTALEK